MSWPPLSEPRTVVWQRKTAQLSLLTRMIDVMFYLVSLVDNVLDLQNHSKYDTVQSQYLPVDSNTWLPPLLGFACAYHTRPASQMKVSASCCTS